MKLLTKGLVLSLLVSTGLMGVEAKTVAKSPAAAELKTEIASQDVQIYTSENADGKITPKTIEEAFVKEGFFISEHRDMNAPFKATFKETSFDIYNLFTVYRKDTVRNLAVKYPQIGLFT
ncbi:MAG TPA: DUF302 domain-containing protein, partial [Campylobacterales bacterium]|nr:DUF302 domain-containing protein [Campylobacterales bacterium]